MFIKVEKHKKQRELCNKADCDSAGLGWGFDPAFLTGPHALPVRLVLGALMGERGSDSHFLTCGGVTQQHVGAGSGGRQIKSQSNGVFYIQNWGTSAPKFDTLVIIQQHDAATSLSTELGTRQQRQESLLVYYYCYYYY